MYELLIQVLTTVRGMWRFRWYAVALAWLVCLGGWTYVYQMPDKYESTARVYLDTQSVLKPLLEGLAVDTDMRSEADMMTRVLRSRPNIEKVIRETDLSLRAETPKQMQSLISSTIRDVNISRDDRNMYTVSYTDTDPELAQRVVQNLLDSLVERTLGSGREDAAYAQKFLRKQLQEYEQRLAEAEQRLAEFKKKHVGLMPGQGGGYYERMQNAMDKLDQTEARLKAAKNRRQELMKQLKGEKSVIGMSELDAKIQQKWQELNDLLLKYTDEHPDVIALRETIRQLQKQKESGNLPQPESDGGTAVNPVYQSLKIAVSEVEVEIATLQSQAADQRAEIEQLEEMVDTIPEVEAKLARLNRDYNVTKKQYETLLQRLESAKLSEGADQSKSDAKFQVVEPPIMPRSPSSPNRFRLLTMVLIAGFAVGGGLAFLLNEMHPVFTTSEELYKAAGLPVLGAVSIKLDEQEQHAMHVNLALLGAAAFALPVLYVVVLVIS